MLPGININDIVSFKEKVRMILNPNSEPYIKLIQIWKKIDNKFFEIVKTLNCEIYYILYQHPVHDFKDKLSKTTKKELLDFINNLFFNPPNNGLDIKIVTEDFSVIFVCNHDDEIYLAHPLDTSH